MIGTSSRHRSARSTAQAAVTFICAALYIGVGLAKLLFPASVPAVDAHSTHRASSSGIAELFLAHQPGILAIAALVEVAIGIAITWRTSRAIALSLAISMSMAYAAMFVVLAQGLADVSTCGCVGSVARLPASGHLALLGLMAALPSVALIWESKGDIVDLRTPEFLGREN